MDKKALIKKHLEDRREQLRALISHLEARGNSHPQYDQLKKCSEEYKLVISQLQKLK